MTLKQALKEGLDLRAGCFLVSNLSSDLPVGDPFAAFAMDETIIGTQAFCCILNDWVPGYFSVTVRACNYVAHYSSLNECLLDGTHLLPV
jgi:hypothetical protein